MQNTPLAIVIIAAGKGTRMRSSLPKVLHAIASRPMIGHVVETAKALAPERIILVTAPGMDLVVETARSFAPDLQSALQMEQLGTGDAVKAALPHLEGFNGTTLVLYGDTPLLTPETLRHALEKLTTADIVVLGMELADPGSYGRLKVNRQGSLESIVEYKDASPEERAISLCNSGVMAVRGGHIGRLLAGITNQNAKGEFYLTDIVALGRAAGLSADVAHADAAELKGVNSRIELAEAEAQMQRRLREAAMLGGATLQAPETVYLCADTQIGQDVLIEPHVVFGPGVRISDRVTIRAYSYLDGCSLASGTRVGPFARIRPGTALAEDVHIGNFVEVKKSEVARGAKINHLSYIGDAFVGEEANIGAGTITCNYDGFYKYETHIGNRAFIGSHTALIAPVVVGEGAIVGAGSVISHDVPPDALALTRSDQVSKPSWATAFRARMGKKGGSSFKPSPAARLR